MSGSGTRKSGGARKKELEKRKRGEQQAVSKTHKLTSYFGQNVADSSSPATSASSRSDASGSSSGGDSDNDDGIASPDPSTSAAYIQQQSSSTPSSDLPSIPVPLQLDIGCWGADITEELRENAIKIGAPAVQNLKDEYPETKRAYSQQNRFRQPSIFKRTMPNGEIKTREWMVYSPAKQSIWCFPCFLFGLDCHNQFCNGFNDWKHGVNYIAQHEKSQQHIDSILKLYQRSTTLGRVDSILHANFIEQRNYWKNVLQRCVATIAFLCERGLPLRGSDEKVGSSSNGNYLGILELISQFDPFMAEHINKCANQGSGHTSYLSKTVVEELIPLMGDKVLTQIKDQIASTHYFSVSVDSTPDVSHTDQLTVIIRYVDMYTCTPVERFLTFLQIYSHTGEELANTLLSYLADCDIDFRNCRGQTYDNASNMSGKYVGMQQQLKNVNVLVDYIPCAGHSMNLVGVHAVDCCLEAVSYFGFVQKIYTFFSGSTHRWAVSVECLKEAPGCVVPKSLSETRWSAHAVAVAAIHSGYPQFKKALTILSDDKGQTADTRNEANSLIIAMGCLETSIMCELWNEILDRFNKCSKLLQSSTIELTTAIGLMDSLSSLIDTCREKFDDYERSAKERCGNDAYKADTKRAKKRKRQFDEGPAADAAESMDARTKFVTGTFYVILDNLKTALKKRIDAYAVVAQRFGVLTQFHSMSTSQIDDAITALVNVYPADLATDFPAEFIRLLVGTRTSLLRGMLKALPRECSSCFIRPVYTLYFQTRKLRCAYIFV